MTKKNTNKSNTYKNGNYTGIYKGDNGNMLTATAMIYEVDGNEVITPIDISFVQLYAFLYDQYRSFQAQNKDFFGEWETVFKAMGRTYNTKKSKDQVKLLESCGLLKQIKLPSDNRRIKIVSDVSVKDIRFVNTEYDAYRAEQSANNATRRAEFAAFNAEKEQANKEAKGQHQQIVISDTAVSAPEEMKAPEPKIEVKAEPPKQQQIIQHQIKQVSDSYYNIDEILSCDVSHDQQFENHYQYETNKPIVKYATHFEKLNSQGYVMNDNRWIDLSQGQQREIAKAVNACNSFHEAANKFMELVDEYTNLQWDDVPF